MIKLYYPDSDDHEIILNISTDYKKYGLQEMERRGLKLFKFEKSIILFDRIINNIHKKKNKKN